jgi:hypothetical protein
MADSSYDKFLPPDDLPEFHQPFWDSVRAHQVRLQRCAGCGRFRYIPLEICPGCGSLDAEWSPISGRGVVYTYTVVHRAPTEAYQRDAPYPIVHVTLDEGPRMIAGLVGVPAQELTIGLGVHLVYDDVAPGITIFNFARTEE